MPLVADTQRVFVTDIGQARRFYCDALKLPLIGGSDDDGIAVFDAGSLTLLVEAVPADDREGAELIGRFVGLSFGVEDMDATISELRGRGVEFGGPPEVQPWGGTLAHFRDPDGNVLTLVA
ncbi:MAG: lactoylglutathione lyase [Pseudohongiellaceae bacterium]|jgi:lactoylglutathione lyase